MSRTYEQNKVKKNIRKERTVADILYPPALIVLQTVIIAAVCMLCSCSMVEREYVFPNDILVMRGETPKQVADGVARAGEYFPEDEYGRVYLNNDGELCYLLNDDQKKNWLARGLDSLEATAGYYTGQGRTFEYSDDFRTFTFMVSGEGTDKIADGSDGDTADPDKQVITDSTMEEITLYSGEILTLQFFSSDGSSTELVTTVIDEDGAVLKRITWQ